MGLFNLFRKKSSGEKKFIQLLKEARNRVNCPKEFYDSFTSDPKIVSVILTEVLKEAKNGLPFDEQIDLFALYVDEAYK